jgi:tetratricopeptide (TPR) repeat protein
VLEEQGLARRAEEESRRAGELSGGLAREPRLFIDALARACAFDWPHAIEKYRTLVAQYPDVLEYQLALSRALLRVGDGEGARAAVEAMRALPNAAADARVDLIAAERANLVTDTAAMAKLAADALAKAQARGSRSLVAEASLMAARARLLRHDDLLQVADDFHAVERMFRELGNRTQAAFAIMRAATALRMGGHPAEARSELARALAEAREIGSVLAEGRIELQLGILERRASTDAARAHEARALAIAREVGDRLAETNARNAVALSDWHSGKLVEARAGFEEAAKIATEIGSKKNETDSLDNLAMVLGDLGQPREELAIHEQMIDRYRAMPSPEDVGMTLYNIAHVLLEEGELDAAEARLGEAETECKAGQDPDCLDAVKGWRAAIARLRGDPAAARVLLKEAIDDERTRGASRTQDDLEGRALLLDVEGGTARSEELAALVKKDDGSAQAHGRLAQSLAVGGATEDAIAEARRTLALARKEESYLQRVEAELAAADALSRAGRREEAASVARPIAADARRRGYLRWALEAELLSAAAEANPAASLGRVAVEADAKGLVIVAKRARASLPSSGRDGE